MMMDTLTAKQRMQKVLEALPDDAAAGMFAWHPGSSMLWLAGAMLLVSVVPVTLLFIKPINDALLNPENDPESDKTRELLEQWGRRHRWRTLLSGVSFLLYLAANASSSLPAQSA